MRRILIVFTTVAALAAAASADPDRPHTTIGPYIETTVFLMNRLARTELQPGTPPGPRTGGVDESIGAWIRPPHGPNELRVGAVMHATAQRTGFGAQVEILRAIAPRQRIGLSMKYLLVPYDEDGDLGAIGVQYHYWHAGVGVEGYRATWKDHEITYGVTAGVSLDGWPALAALPLEALAIALQME